MHAGCDLNCDRISSHLIIVASLLVRWRILGDREIRLDPHHVAAVLDVVTNGSNAVRAVRLLSPILSAHLGARAGRGRVPRKEAAID